MGKLRLHRDNRQVYASGKGSFPLAPLSEDDEEAYLREISYKAVLGISKILRHS